MTNDQNLPAVEPYRSTNPYPPLHSFVIFRIIIEQLLFVYSVNYLLK